jgi:hypothetical protein
MKTVSSLQKFLVTALLVACSIGGAQAALFVSNSANTISESVIGFEFNTHFFTADASDAGMIYRATLRDLDLTDGIGFISPFTTLELAVSDLPATTLYGTAIARPGTGTAYFDFPIYAAGSFAAYVKGLVEGGGLGIYEVQLTKIGLIPEPGVWLMMIGGLGLIGWMRLRKSQELS